MSERRRLERDRVRGRGPLARRRDASKKKIRPPTVWIV
ncbi:hypothetical protein CZ771_02370 [Actinomycetales bacterium JB111]|nr:hypothetical protein CZ771_02370 [Actinomycetales bacterium JB111]